MPKLLSDEGLEKYVLMGKGYALVLFFDYGSVPCDNFRKEWDALPGLLSGIGFYELEVAENPGISKEIGILAIPTTILFLSGTVISSYEGPYSRETLVERIKGEIGNAR
jgi:thioredoxin-like negative regulator of GroEL